MLEEIDRKGSVRNKEAYGGRLSGSGCATGGTFHLGVIMFGRGEYEVPSGDSEMTMMAHNERSVRRGVLALILLTACGDTEELSAGSDDAGASDEGSVSDSTDGAGAPNGGSDVPPGGYCAGVSDWSAAEREFETEVVELVNLERADGADCGGESFGSAGPLVMEPILRCAARVHSLDMSERQFFDHINPDGEDPFDRMEQAGYRMLAGGENIAAGQPTPVSVVEGWMESPGHCRNIMNPDFTEIGVGYVLTDQGSYPHYWTQVFGRPQ